MAVEDWIDNLAALWEISDGRGGTVKSYRVYEKAEFPAAITIFPSAITYVVDLDADYSLGGPLLGFWRGKTEFHLFPSADKSYLPECMLYFQRILAAAAGSIQLGGTVSQFLLQGNGAPSIQGPFELRYSNEEPHWGLVVNWVVKEALSLTVSA